jgi:hypothetical protein
LTGARRVEVAPGAYPQYWSGYGVAGVARQCRGFGLGPVRNADDRRGERDALALRQAVPYLEAVAD